MAEAGTNVLREGAAVTKAVSLLKPLSAGGMGAVWLADHLGLKTRVVVKFMLVGLDSSDSARSRFSREAAAAAQVKSPHVVQMLDHGVTDEGVPFIVMEHLEGKDLGDEIEARGAIDPGTVVVIVSQVAKALSKVHAAGLLHRDIKPDNIFLCEGEEDIFVKLLDFGIAKSSSIEQGDGSLDGETKTGQIVGTPFYMSPEQVTAQKAIDHRSDLWALGVVAYEALTGQRPYDGPSFGALAVRIATGDPPKPTDANPALPPAIDLWFAKACARNPAERFSSAKEMADAFRAVFEGVVSLPAGAASADSGERATGASSGARSGSHPDARSGSGPRGSRPSADEGAIGFASTALDDSDAARRKRNALGRSEAGVSLVEGRRSPRSSPVLFIGGAVAITLAVAAAIYRSAQPTTSASTMSAGATSASPSVTTSASVSLSPPVPVSAASLVDSGAPIVAAVDAGQASAASATKTPAPAPTRATTGSKVPTSAPPAPVKAPPDPAPVTPKPPPKPSVEADPLY